MSSTNDLSFYISQLIDAGHFLSSHGLIVEAAGNVSLLTEKNRVLITGRGANLSSLTDEDFSLIDFEGNKFWGNCEPTLESALHLIMYQERLDIGAVVHTHSPNATALAIIGKSIPPIVDEMTIILGGEVRVTDYAFPGTVDIAQKALEALEDRMAALLANHGVIALGRDIQEALKVAHLVEHVSKVYLLSMGAGSVKPIPNEAFEEQRSIFKKRKEKYSAGA